MKCLSCGHDPGFDFAVCPNCRSRPDGSGAPELSNTDRWEKTMIEREVLAAPAARARFGGRGDFFEEITPRQGRQGLRFGDGPDDSDKTILDRGGRSKPDEDGDGDHTVIMRGGHKGVVGPLVYLVQRNGLRTGKVYLVTEETTIGRTADNEIVLGDDTVSKHHAKVWREDGVFRFWDLASGNGSFLIGTDSSRKRVLEPHVLADGDTFELGAVRLTYIEVDRGPEE